MLGRATYPPSNLTAYDHVHTEQSCSLNHGCLASPDKPPQVPRITSQPTRRLAYLTHSWQRDSVHPPPATWTRRTPRPGRRRRRPPPPRCPPAPSRRRATRNGVPRPHIGLQSGRARTFISIEGRARSRTRSTCSPLRGPTPTPSGASRSPSCCGTTRSPGLHAPAPCARAPSSC